jgi:hypothetical protein
MWRRVTCDDVGYGYGPYGAVRHLSSTIVPNPHSEDSAIKSIWKARSRSGHLIRIDDRPVAEGVSRRGRPLFHQRQQT